MLLSCLSSWQILLWGGGVKGHRGQGKIQRAVAVIASLFPHRRVIAYMQYLTDSISPESC